MFHEDSIKNHSATFIRRRGGSTGSARLRHGVADERKERLTLRLVAISFYVLAANVTVEGIRSLVSGEQPERSLVAIVLLVLSLIAMPLR